MIYEIVAVIYLLFTLLIFLFNVDKIIHEVAYKGRNLKKMLKENKGKAGGIAIFLLLALLFGLFSWAFTISFMLWTASKGIIIAKYYAFGFIGYLLIFTIIPSIFIKKRKIRKNLSLRTKIFRYLTTFLELGITIYALWIII